VPDAAECDLCGASVGIRVTLRGRACGPERGQGRREWIAELGSVGMARRWVGGRLPPHVEYREWPTAVVEG
jgi:hypothetical protein